MRAPPSSSSGKRSPRTIAPGMRIYIVFAINVLNNTSSFANRVLLALFAVRIGEIGRAHV